MKPAVLALVIMLPICHAEQALLPVLHVPVQDLCDALVRNPVMLPHGLTRLWPIPERDALVAEGTASAVGQLREILLLLDQPRTQIAVEVGLLVTPAAGPGAFRAELLSPPASAGPGQRGFHELLKGYRERGGTVVASRRLGVVLVPNMQEKTVWLDRDFAALCDPSALASGVAVVPRALPDGQVALDVALIAALTEEGLGARFLQQSQVQATVADGDSLIYGGQLLGEGGENRQEAVIVVIPRVVFAGPR